MIGVVVGEQLLEELIGGGVQRGGQGLHVVLVEEGEDGHEGGCEDRP